MTYTDYFRPFAFMCTICHKITPGSTCVSVFHNVVLLSEVLRLLYTCEAGEQGGREDDGPCAGARLLVLPPHPPPPAGQPGRPVTGPDPVATQAGA